MSCGVSREISRSDQKNWNHGQSGREFFLAFNDWHMALS
jgi:hypothetical protein